MLAEDDEKKTLNYNERNCILYRKGEKVILNYLKETSAFVQELLKMSSKDAKVKVNTSPAEILETTGGYLKGVVL